MFRVVAIAVALPFIAGCHRASPGSMAMTAPSVAPLTLQSEAHIIRRGRMGVTVKNVEPARVRLESAATALGARISRLEANEDGAVYTLRVPADRLTPLMDSAATLGDVGDRTLTADEVTDQVIDAEARLEALKATRDRLRQLVDRAANVTDVVTVERELARVQAELESLQARVNSLRGQVALSDLNVNLRKRHILGPLGLVAAGVGFVIQKLFVWN